MTERDEENPSCKFCGSDNVRKAGIHYLSHRRAQRYQCKDCGRIFLGEAEELPCQRNESTI